MEYLIFYAASREVTVAHTLHRHFWWYNNILWLEDIPKSIGIVVALSGRDEILNPTAIAEYVLFCKKNRSQPSVTDQSESTLRNSADLALRPSSLKLAPMRELFWDKFSHGQFLLHKSAQSELIAAIALNEKQICVI